MKDKKAKNYSILIAISFLILGLIIVHYWRNDVEYKQCWEIVKELKGENEWFNKTKCGDIIRNKLIK